jgi:DnaJ-class molecular chaperone
MTTYLIEKVTTCPECKGAKMQDHPHWAAFWRNFGKGGNSLTAEQMETWFNDNFGDAYLPDEETTCAECEGRGTVTTQIDLRQALEEIENEKERQEMKLFFPRKS